ncbi:hypothetical protein [Thalassotalea ganghwensis]
MDTIKQKDLNMLIARLSLKILSICIFLFSASATSCEKAQMIDYDYQIKETLGNGYSTFGRLWLLDKKEKCINSSKYGACISIEPIEDAASLTIKITKKEGTSSTHSQKIKYNSSEVIRFNTMSMDVYLKLYVSNTIADLKMSGRSCDNGFPNIPRQVTRKELNNMFRG